MNKRFTLTLLALCVGLATAHAQPASIKAPGTASAINDDLDSHIFSSVHTTQGMVAMPHVHHQWMPDVLRVEKGLSPDTLHRLEQKGHTIAIKPTMGRTQTIQILPDGFYGCSDPRNPDGMTAGY